MSMSDAERPIRPEWVSSEEADSGRSHSRLLAYLQLLRAPNVFTAFADVAMGYLVTTRSVADWTSFSLLLAASGMLYTAGMVLNDVFDLPVDRIERPRRPLPSGRISESWARTLGFLLLAAGLVCGWLAGWMSEVVVGPAWRSGLIATVLAGTVLLYDAAAKKTPLGPVVMGACRALNVLLGMSLNAMAVVGEPAWLGFGTSHYLIAAGIGLYIVGVTCFARREASVSPRPLLLLGLTLMFAGIALLALFPRWHPEAFDYRYEPRVTWPFAVLLLSIWILRRPALALINPTPRSVQMSVKHCILSLIVLDATLCTLVCPWPYGVAIVALLAPTMLLGQWVYST